MAELPLLTRLEYEKHHRIYRLIQAKKRPRRMETNDEVAANTRFLECCRRAGIKPTKRQASKFRNQKGSAYKMR